MVQVKAFSRFFLIGLFSLSLVFIAACGNSAQMQAEVDTLKTQVAQTQEENANLRKQVELLSQTVKQLSELNAMLQGEKGEDEEAAAAKEEAVKDAP